MTQKVSERSFYERHDKAIQVGTVATVFLVHGIFLAMLATGVLSYVGGLSTAPYVLHVLHDGLMQWSGLPLCMVVAGGVGAFVTSSFALGCAGVFYSRSRPRNEEVIIPVPPVEPPIEEDVPETTFKDRLENREAIMEIFEAHDSTFFADERFDQFYQRDVRGVQCDVIGIAQGVPEGEDPLAYRGVVIEEINDSAMNRVEVVENFNTERKEVLRILKTNKKTALADNGYQVHLDLLEKGVPYIVDIYGMIEEEELKGAVLEYCEGGEIASVFAKDSYDLQKRVLFAYQVVDAVAQIHEVGYIHRDLSLWNILLGEEGIRIIDFDFAVKIGRKVTPSGTPLFMGPEYDGKETLIAEPFLDNWALGLILYAAIFQALPGDLEGRSWQQFSEELGQELAEEEMDDDLRQIVMGLLTLNPEERWTAARAREALGKFVGF